MKLSLSFSINLEKTSRMALEISSSSSAMHLENAVHLSIYLSVLRREMRERERERERERKRRRSSLHFHNNSQLFLH
jgi:hypothetical protein